LLQQISTQHGIFKNRVRLEQRFVDNLSKGWRLRTKHGVDIPIDDKWSFNTDAEFFFTLRPTGITGTKGFSEQRTRVFVNHRLDKHTNISVGYMRSQVIRRNREDTVGHTPIISLDYNF
jgi:hypothetical protein